MYSMTKYQKRTTCVVPYTIGAHTLENVSDSKYLGDTLNEHREWSTHTQMTAGKAHATLSFLEHNLLTVVSQHFRERAYLVIVWPALEFTSAITEPHLSCDIKRLDSVQWHAAHAVTNNPQRRYGPEQDHVIVTVVCSTSLMALFFMSIGGL